MVALNPAYTPEKSASRSQNRIEVDQSASRLGIGEKYDASSRMASGHSKLASGTTQGAMGTGQAVVACIWRCDKWNAYHQANEIFHRHFRAIGNGFAEGSSYDPELKLGLGGEMKVGNFELSTSGKIGLYISGNGSEFLWGGQ